ncbi:MAG: prepilin-type N-terminal cleavage/methylation domain-containing protein [Bacilli bacterium]
MRRNGFTLIELLAVVALLAILVSVSSISVSSIKKKQDVKNCENMVNSILTGAKKYTDEHDSVLDMVSVSGDKTAYISIANLKKGNFIDDDLINPVNGKDISINYDINPPKPTDVKVKLCGNNDLKVEYVFSCFCEGNRKEYTDDGCKVQTTKTR